MKRKVIQIANSTSVISLPVSMLILLEKRNKLERDVKNSKEIFGKNYD